VRQSPKRWGFSLTELMVVLALMGILFGLAVFGFIGLSRSMRLSSATGALNQAMINARQRAITTRTPQRVGIHLIDGRYWGERKVMRSGRTESARWEVVTETQSLPKSVVVGDVGGMTADRVPGNEKVWFIEFDSRGSVTSYAKGLAPERKNVAIHLIMENARIPLSENDQRMYNLNDSGLLEYIGNIEANDENDDGLDDGYSVDIKITAEARKQVNTVFILALTGRSQTFEYGYGFPWSEENVVER